MTQYSPEQLGSREQVDRLAQAHPVLDTRDVRDFLEKLHNEATPYAQEMLNSAITAAIEHTDSSQVALAFRGFAERVQTQRQKAIDVALKQLVAELNFGKNSKQA
ncbi:MAG: hypothetical protein HHAS10_00190 [Candidatus Altimarinota bacterium]